MGRFTFPLDRGVSEVSGRSLTTLQKPPLSLSLSLGNSD